MMLTKAELGRRLRTARFERDMTLKDVAARAGMSATHISEVERGKTSPTIGALQRIAGALGEKPSYFVEERPVPTTAFGRASERTAQYMADADGKPLRLEYLTPGIPAGVLKISERRSGPGERFAMAPMVVEVVVLCLAGMIRYTLGETSVVLREGDALHMNGAEGALIETLGEEDCVVLSMIAMPSPLL